VNRPRDAIVIGAGPNGLVAANLLADAGWDVLVLEAQPRCGGSVLSDTDVAEGFVHDTFSAFYPLAAASPVITRLRLEDHGLVWRRAPAVLGLPRPDGGWVLLHDEPERTAAGLDEHHRGDGEAWLALCRDWQRIGPALIEALLSPFPPVRGGLKALVRLPSVGGLDFLRTMLEPAATLASTRFGSEEARLLLASNALHADIPMTAAGSGLLGLLLSMVGQTHGFPVPEGGSSRLTQALVDRFVGRGGRIRTGTRVQRVLTSSRRAGGVVTDDGESITARAVIADVAVTALYGRLVPWDELPARVRRRMARFELDPATIKVDWALSGPVPWSSPPELAPGTVHLTDSLDQLSRSHHEIDGSTVPADPFLLVGQMTTTDPTRSPVGTESVWAYTHLPQVVHRDAGPDEISGSWDDSEIERLADRMQARLERYAPGFGSRVLARRVLGPKQLEARNENLINGALAGGSANLHQELIFRPIAGWGRAETPIAGLYLGSASAHPGGAVHGACGANAARALLAAARTGRI
jgi:phytoene dehydrogenase-like protein